MNNKCNHKIIMVDSNIVRLFKDLNAEGNAAEDKERIYKEMFREFITLSSEERQSYFIEKGLEGIEFVDFLWTCSILDWLNDELCGITPEISEKIEDKALALEDIGDIARLFFSFKIDLMHAKRWLEARHENKS